MSYNFVKHIAIAGAFNEYLQHNFQYYDLLFISGEDITITTKRVLTYEELIILTNLVANYVDPYPWLVLNSTENQLMDTATSNSSTPILLQTFIMSPGINLVICNSIKLVVEYSAEPANLIGFNPETENINITFELFDITRNIIITTISDNINSLIVGWLNGDTGAKYKTIQFYGLVNKITGYDCIWQLKGSINDPRVSFRLTCLQKLLYDQLFS